MFNKLRKKQNRRMRFIQPIAFQINHVNKYNLHYRVKIRMTIYLLASINSMLFESITFFPLGWLSNGITVIAMENVCFYTKKTIPCLFKTCDNQFKTYRFLFHIRYGINFLLILSIVEFILLVNVIFYVLEYIYVWLFFLSLIKPFLSDMSKDYLNKWICDFLSNKERKSRSDVKNKPSEETNKWMNQTNLKKENSQRWLGLIIKFDLSKTSVNDCCCLSSVRDWMKRERERENKVRIKIERVTHHINGIVSSDNYPFILSGMLSIVEPIFSLPNQSSSIDYEQLSCISNMKIWLVVHFMTTWLVEHLLLCFLIPPYFIMVLFFHRYWGHFTDVIDSYLADIFDLDRYSSMIIVLKSEMKLIFVYVYLAFLCTWLGLVNSNSTVTYLSFLRWLIEASLLPQVSIISLFFYFLTQQLEFCHEYYALYVCKVFIKIPKFILMRYVESQSDLFINTYQAFLFKVLCKWSSKTNIH